MGMAKEEHGSRICETVATYQEDILQFTQELVTIATENPPGNLYGQCVEVIQKKLMELGLGCEVIEVPVQETSSGSVALPRYCLLSNYGTGEKTFYFHGHYDVVPASQADQFQPYIKHGKLFGRGSSDMKSGIAAMIYAIKTIQVCDIELNGQIGLTIVPDEETGGDLGSKYLSEINKLGKQGIGMLLAEPTSGVVWNANRGAISLRITVKGRPAHVGLQHQGINAFEKMLVVADAMLALKNEVGARITDFNIQPEEAGRSILLMGGRCEGGSSFNLVPGECAFTLDRRINPEENLEEEKIRIFDVLESLKKDDIDLEVEILQEGKSAGISEDHPLAQTLASNIEFIKGKRPRFELCPGLLENRFYSELGIPAFAYGPGLLQVSHGPNEYVEIEQIFKCTSVYALTAIDALSD